MLHVCVCVYAQVHCCGCQPDDSSIPRPPGGSCWCHLQPLLDSLLSAVWGGHWGTTLAPHGIMLCVVLLVPPGKSTAWCQWKTLQGPATSSWHLRAHTTAAVLLVCMCVQVHSVEDLAGPSNKLTAASWQDYLPTLQERHHVHATGFSL